MNFHEIFNDFSLKFCPLLGEKRLCLGLVTPKTSYSAHQYSDH
jgi:hypothetical protein